MVNIVSKSYSSATCSALLKKVPSSPSGLYFINPEGLVSSPVVQVYCNMTSKSGVGVTVIGHDIELRTLVKGYESAGSYKRKINYNISMQQIVAIMNHSKNCDQYIKYECYHSGMYLYSSLRYAWWVSRQGWKMNYWGGAAVNSGKCACGMTNSCARKTCNCDKNDLVWREDSGYLTDKNTLPVTELRFGDTGNIVGSGHESGYHTLGKLRCWG